MNNDDKSKPDNKKRLPGGFLLFLLGTMLVILILQNFTKDRTGKVAFSHQIEHLVNLELIQTDDSKKIALNDNLVTFSGKFKDSLSDDAKNRYRYLELLDQSHQLQADSKRVSRELSILEKNARDAADLFLSLSSIAIPANGYMVVDSIYDAPDRDNAIVVKKLTERSLVSYNEVLALTQKAVSSPTSEHVQDAGKSLYLLIQSFRAPNLGIGNDQIKAKLKTLSDRIQSLENDSTISLQERSTTYEDTLAELKGIIDQVATKENNARLLPLRSVRDYVNDVNQYNTVYEKLIDNESQLSKARQPVSDVIWFFNNKELSTRALETQDPEEFNNWFLGAKQEWENFAANRGMTFQAPDQPRNAVLEKKFRSEEPSPNYFSYLLTLLPVILIVLLLYAVFSKQMKGMGSNAMNFGKSPAKLLNKSSNKVTFKDVAGVEEAKEELEEIVDFLKDPQKFTTLGARIPRGVLCIGAPGTGKTLIAKAVAGEADRPFFSISGSDFVEMFVGVGASRIRDLFDQAKKNAPCIVFIDEIDAVGRHRGAGIGGGHDEREQTLNQLLVEMDGFDTNEGVILIAATNRPDVLDKALLRPGRFDRRVILDLPDIKGRLEILKVHARKIKLDASVDLMAIARNTPGSSGADLANVLNEAALIAARKNRSAVTGEDTLEACDKVRYGKERRSLVLDDQEKKNTAYHESGHAIVSLIVEKSDPVEKVTIIPRGMSLGATHFSSEKNRVSYWSKELVDKLAVLMGGRVAEEIFLGDVSSGAQMDITQATNLAKSMICEWGMNDKLGKVAYGSRSEEGQYLMPGRTEKNYSEDTAKEIDQEVKKLLDVAYARATDILKTHSKEVILMSEMLLEFESLDADDVKAIIKGTWDSEAKRKKVENAATANRRLPPPPPKKIIDTDILDGPQTDNPNPQQI